jgi:hypothetical protein
MFSISLQAILKEGEGHTIFQVSEVRNALFESRIDSSVDFQNKSLILSDGKKKFVILLMERPEVIAPKSKYDIEHWGDRLGQFAIWDLSLIANLCKMLGARSDEVGSYIGRGFQYRAYYEWLIKYNFVKKGE